MNIDPASQGGASAIALLRRLDQEGYRFVTPTPATHGRVLARARPPEGGALRLALGWNLPVAADALDRPVFDLLQQTDALLHLGAGLVRSRVRVSSLHETLFLHSGFPTDEQDAVFLGPDSYRFADLLRQEIGEEPPGHARVLDIGAGAGVGAIVAGRLWPRAQVLMNDINPQALRFAVINAAAAGIDIEVEPVSHDGVVDLVLANPPYMIDADGPAYRNGGDLHGGGASLQIARVALQRLAPGGRLILYTGAAIVGGTNPLYAALRTLAAEHGCAMRAREIDPDVFGEELDKPGYAHVERIAVMAVVISRP